MVNSMAMNRRSFGLGRATTWENECGEIVNVGDYMRRWIYFLHLDDVMPAGGKDSKCWRPEMSVFLL